MTISERLNPKQSDLFNSSLADIPASPSHMPASALALQMSVTSGLRLLDLYATLIPPGAFSRTLLATSLWGSTKCWLTWTDSVTPTGRLLFQLRPQMLLTDEIGSGLLPTPMAQDTAPRENPEYIQNRIDKGHPITLAMHTAMWPTPCARDWKGPTTENWHTTTLPDAVRTKLWPTPVASSGLRGSSTSDHEKYKYFDHGPLNPTWVEWLMGYPTGWTDLEHSATPSCRK